MLSSSILIKIHTFYKNLYIICNYLHIVLFSKKYLKHNKFIHSKLFIFLIYRKNLSHFVFIHSYDETQNNH